MVTDLVLIGAMFWSVGSHGINKIRAKSAFVRAIGSMIFKDKNRSTSAAHEANML
jgi:hypothetical protein